MPPLSAGAADASLGSTLWTSSMIGIKGRSMGTTLGSVSTAWPSVNLAILVPFVVTVPTSFARIFFEAGTTPGTTNYDLGVYRDDFTRVASLGATAAVNTTDAVLPVGGGALPMTLPRGRYYIAMSSAATTLTVRATGSTNGASRAYGCLSMATAHPLPTTITPAQAVAAIPSMGLTTVSNML